MKNKLLNQRGLTLVELLASLVIIMLIIGPMLALTFSLFNYSIEDGERNQLTNIGQAVMEEAKELVSNGGNTYSPSRPEYADYDIDVEINEFSLNGDLTEINVTVSKINSSFEPITLKTVVRNP